MLGVTDGEARLFNIEPTAPGYSVALNRADWVTERLNDAARQAAEVSYLVAGRAAAVVFAFTSSPRCDPAWFVAEIDGVRAPTTLRHNELRMDDCGVAGCSDGKVNWIDHSFTELRVEWMPEAPSIQTINLSTPGYQGDVPARVGRHRESVEPLAILPKRCWDVRQIGPEAFLCDQSVFANGTEIASFDKAALVIGWQGFVAVWKGNLLRVFTYERAQLSEVASLELVDTAPHALEWHEQAGLLYLAGARQHTVGVSFDGEHLGQRLVDLGPSASLTILGEYLMLTRAAAQNEGLEVCVLDPRDNFASSFCNTFGVFYAGFDRGVWFRNGHTVGLIRPVSGKPEVVATWRSVERAPVDFIRTIDSDPRFTSSPRGRPAELATRASCAFYELDGSAELTLDVYPENEIQWGDRSITGILFARGDGREGLRWCSNEGWTKTYIYASDRAD